jgi:hypothetical protein
MGPLHGASLYGGTLKMYSMCFSGLVISIYKTAQYLNSETNNLNTHRNENLETSICIPQVPTS